MSQDELEFLVEKINSELRADIELKREILKSHLEGIASIVSGAIGGR